MAEVTRHSLYVNSWEVEDDDGFRYTTEVEPYPYEKLPDNIEHICVEGDTWHSIASKYWSPIPQAGTYSRAIADFQPDPILDPFIKLQRGQKIIVPSRITFESKILDPERRRFF